MVKSDVLVLGGGPGGYLAAERAAQGARYDFSCCSCLSRMFKSEAPSLPVCRYPQAHLLYTTQTLKFLHKLDKELERATIKID